MKEQIIMKFKFRKILALGRAYYASIPKTWLESNNLEKGSRVYISLREDGSLIIEPRQEVSQ